MIGTSPFMLGMKKLKPAYWPQVKQLIEKLGGLSTKCENNEEIDEKKLKNITGHQKEESSPKRKFSNNLNKKKGIINKSSRDLMNHKGNNNEEEKVGKKNDNSKKKRRSSNLASTGSEVFSKSVKENDQTPMSNNKKNQEKNSNNSGSKRSNSNQIIPHVNNSPKVMAGTPSMKFPNSFQQQVKNTTSGKNNYQPSITNKYLISQQNNNNNYNAGSTKVISTPIGKDKIEIKFKGIFEKNENEIRELKNKRSLKEMNDPWPIDELNDNLVINLIESLEEILTVNVCGLMTSWDYSKHIQATKIFIEENNIDNLKEISDLIVKWIFARIWGNFNVLVSFFSFFFIFINKYVFFFKLIF